MAIANHSDIGGNQRGRARRSVRADVNQNGFVTTDGAGSDAPTTLTSAEYVWNGYLFHELSYPYLSVSINGKKF